MNRWHIVIWSILLVKKQISVFLGHAKIVNRFILPSRYGSALYFTGPYITDNEEKRDNSMGMLDFAV